MDNRGSSDLRAPKVKNVQDEDQQSATREASYSDLKIMSLGYRWGSCSIGGRLNIHWATMQLPPDLIDYVLVHELAHLHVRNHAEPFWKRVRLAMPDYTARRNRLKQLGPDLWLPE
ncbi:M48 family metallopeptidase [Nonomuraea sp. NBC_00507]|uniref:M48 metallopeptidase family protein n=1 Tax=Nonomuraea sp. NBC_00507 TaxID=2976002 RepID=UPI002E1783E8